MPQLKVVPGAYGKRIPRLDAKKDLEEMVLAFSDELNEYPELRRGFVERLVEFVLAKIRRG